MRRKLSAEARELGVLAAKTGLKFVDAIEISRR